MLLSCSFFVLFVLFLISNFKLILDVNVKLLTGVWLFLDEEFPFFEKVPVVFIFTFCTVDEIIFFIISLSNLSFLFIELLFLSNCELLKLLVLLLLLILLSRKLFILLNSSRTVFVLEEDCWIFELLFLLKEEVEKLFLLFDMLLILFLSVTVIVLSEYIASFVVILLLLLLSILLLELISFFKSFLLLKILFKFSGFIS